MIDDDSNGIIDDANELETSPPTRFLCEDLRCEFEFMTRSAGTAGNCAAHICSTENVDENCV